MPVLSAARTVPVRPVPSPAGFWTLLLAGVLAVLLLAPTAWAQPSVEAANGGYVATETRTFSVEPGGMLDLTSPGGSITLSSWDRNEVRVEETIRMRDLDREEAERFVRENPTEYAEDGNTVTVDARTGRRRAQHDFEIRVPRRFSAELQTSGGSVSVEDMEGSLDARTSGGSIDVAAVTGPVDVRTSGGSIELTDIDGRAEAQTAGGSIEARSVTGDLAVETAGGSIEIETAGGSVRAETAGGSIRVTGVEGTLRANTAGGDIRITNAAQSVTAETAGGDIELDRIGGAVDATTSGGDIEGRGLRSRIRARTSAGDIELGDVRAGVDARTSVGDIEIEMTLSDFSGDYATSLRSSHGDIELLLPAGLPASIDAEVRSLYGSVDREDIYSDFPLTRQMPDDGDVLRATGDLNGGGPSFDLRCDGGSIRIEKGN